MFYLRTDTHCLIGASPEIMWPRPRGPRRDPSLAGTRKRGKTEAEDNAWPPSCSPIPRNERKHIMLVDLGR